ESCLTQTDPDWELWILDNSSDGTPEVMKAFTDPRIHFIHEPRRLDPGTCLNEMLRLASGEHFSYVHTDNRLMPDYVARFRATLNRDPMALAYCDYYEIDAEGLNPRLRKRPEVFPLPRLFSMDALGVPFSATTALAAAVGGFTSDDLADDCFFTMRADGLGPRLHIGEPLVEYRVHGQSRTEASGTHGVAQSIYRSALKAYGQRDQARLDPFSGADAAIRKHVSLASRTALVLARAMLAKVKPRGRVWIDGTGPASFWLAWACGECGHPPAGFRGGRAGSLLGLPVLPLEEALPAGDVCLRPRRKGLDPASHRQDWKMPLRWLLRGLPPQDHAIKRYPAPVMAGLLIPFHHQDPGEGPVWICGQGALAAYLAFGLETIACRPVAGWVDDIGDSRFGLPAGAPPGATVWTLDDSRQGFQWSLRGAKGA
ncbi:MAG TPA: glycosyltransferase family 2 protein, partial [Holophagaceae bacterium]|nr:glycosyltransferase family 2 protein [Holophagaceae bacterium]